MQMKIKGVRWLILSLIVLITAINILERGTLNYMWQDGKDKTTGKVLQPGIASELHIVSNDMAPEERQQRSKEVFALTGFSASIMLMFILGGFQFAITNIQTLPSDFHSGKTVGSLAGMGGASAILGIVLSTYLVPMLTRGGNWIPFFVMGGILIPLSVLSVFIFAPKEGEIFSKHG